MNRIDRLTGTLLMLQSQRRLSVNSIASHWEISERTVYRDIAALCEAGVPIVFEPEIGYRLMGGYEVPPVMFSQEEAVSLFLSGEIAEQVADVSLKKSIRTALLKIKSVLPEERQRLLEGFKNSLNIWISSSSPDMEADCLVPIHNAVLQQKQMAVHYDTASKGAIRERIVEPLGVVYYGRHWHLIAFCQYRKEYRDFRMDRVKQWEVLEQTFSGHEDFSLEEFITHYDELESLTPISVIVCEADLPRFTRYLHEDSTTIEELNCGDGKKRIKFYAMSLDWTARWIMGFGSGVVVEEPIDMVDLIKALAKEVMSNYS